MRASTMSTPAGTTRVRDLDCELAGDVVGVVPQGQTLAGAVVIRVAVGYVTQGGLALGIDEGDEILDAIGRPGAVTNLPHHHGCYLDRVAVSIVHLHRRGLFVADPDGHLSSNRERVHPAQAGLTDSALVAPEQLNDPYLAGGDGGQPSQPAGGQNHQYDADGYSSGPALSDDDDAHDITSD